jgi:hypothetical protein
MRPSADTSLLSFEPASRPTACDSPPAVVMQAALRNDEVINAEMGA